MTMIVDPTGKEATVSIDAQLRVDDLEVLIRELARLRQQMLPEVAVVADLNSAPISGSNGSRVAFSMRIDSAGTCRLWVRDRGLGWIVHDFPVEAVMTLYEGFRRAVSSLPPAAPLVLSFDSITHPTDEW